MIADITKEMTKHMVVDIETLGIQLGSPLLSIGAVCGTRTFYVVISPTQGQVDMNTFNWWHSDQVSQEAKDHVFRLNPLIRRQPLSYALKSFKHFLFECGASFMWGCSPDFDFGHLAHWYKEVGLEVPWEFWQLRDIRTIRGFLSPEEKAAVEDKTLIKHIAIDDAIQEQLYLKAFLQKVGPCYE